MARKVAAADSSEGGGISDLTGIALIAGAILLSVALFSYDAKDVRFNVTSPNSPAHNWIGIFGAYIAYGFFLVFGAAAFLLPALMIGFGLAGFFPALAGFRKRWIYAVLLTLACMGLLDLYSDTLQLAMTSKSTSAGGVIGKIMNRAVFGLFGKFGATLILAIGYVLSLLLLTNLNLRPLVSDWWERKKQTSSDAPSEDPHLAAEERALERRARELQKQARKLQEQVENPNLGPQPPCYLQEPTVRDLSVANGRAKPIQTPPEPPAPHPIEEGEVIQAHEFAAATARFQDPPQTTCETKHPEQSPQPPEPIDDSPAVHLPVPAIVPKGKMAGRRSKPITVASTPLIGNYQLPSTDCLNYPDPAGKPTESREELVANARLMQNTLAQFDIDVALGDITKGPTITRYELHPAPGVRLEKITALSNNIAAALKAERIHILAPVPGKSSVGVEVPNLVKTKVIMRDLVESEEWANTKCRIPLALGKDVYGHPIIADLGEMPHLLIAGSTGSGKSVCINSIIASLLLRFSPDQLRFVMIDPKVVELQQYNGLPHLVVPVVNDPKKVILALRWVVNEMEKRYQIFAKVGVRNIKSFNERPRHAPPPPLEPELPLDLKTGPAENNSEGFAVELDQAIVVPRDDEIVIPEKLSYIVVIIDELADLMLVAPADVEMAIARITQMARAAGIHCIVATQRPSVDVITGVIKANIPARIAFQVAAKVDSRTILDAMGADKLLGKGDMLYLPPGSAKLTRAQGVLITDQEIQSMVDSITRQGKPSYELEIHQQLSKQTSSPGDESGCDEDEDVIQQCIEVIRSEQKASVSLMQRRLRLGYTRAARIMDELENRGIVGPTKGAEPRDILIDLDGNGAGGPGQGS